MARPLIILFVLNKIPILQIFTKFDFFLLILKFL